MSSILEQTKDDVVFEAVAQRIERTKEVFRKDNEKGKDESYIEARFIISNLDVNNPVLLTNVRNRALELIDGLPISLAIEPRGSDCVLILRPTH